MTARTPAGHRLRRVAPGQPLRWLARGARDLARSPGPGLLHGLAAALFGGILFVLAKQHFWLVAGAFSSFLIVAPLIVTGLYAVSRALERGEPAGWDCVRAVWRQRALRQRLLGFGAGLALAGSGWVLTSGALIVGFAPAPVAGPRDFVQVVVLGSGWLFETWLLLGALLAAPVFASTVLTIPMLLDGDAPLPLAIATSWRAVMENPAPLALWAAIIVALTLLAMAAALAGLILVLPWLAHASWHAWRDLVESPAAR